MATLSNHIHNYGLSVKNVGQIIVYSVMCRSYHVGEGDSLAIGVCRRLDLQDNLELYRRASHRQGSWVRLRPTRTNQHLEFYSQNPARCLSQLTVSPPSSQTIHFNLKNARLQQIVPYTPRIRQLVFFFILSTDATYI